MGDETESAIEKGDSIKCLNAFVQENVDLAMQMLEATASIQAGCMLLVDVENEIVWSNKAASVLLGFEPTELIHKDIHSIIPTLYQEESRIGFKKEGSVQLQSRKQDLMEGNSALLTTIVRTLTTIRTAQGLKVPVELTIKRLMNSSEQYRLFLMLDRHQMENAKQAEEMQQQRFKLVSDAAPIGILQANASWEATYVNNRWCQIAGLSIEEVLRLGWINSFSVQNLTKMLSLMQDSLKQGKEMFHETYLRTPLGENYRVELRISPIIFSDGTLHGFIALLTDITIRYMAEQKLRELAEKDALTGLINRAKFQEMLRELLSEKDSSDVRLNNIALLCVDLDGFKNVNDSFGHDGGDALLRQVASRFHEVAKDAQIIARVGGDEFMLVLKEVRFAVTSIREAALTLAKSLLKRLSDKFIINDQAILIGASVGIAFRFANEDIEIDTLIKQADTALYHAKSTGRNNVQVYTGVLRQIDKERSYLLNGLPLALERNQFQVLYQLQSDVATGKIVGAEALLRWRHPSLGLLGPEKFIPLFESSGNMSKVNRLLWHQVFKDVVQWKKRGVIALDFRISINVSPTELLQPTFSQDLMSILSQYEVHLKNVTLEITETALMENFEVIRSVLENLRHAGFRIALDDFGTGYSSMTNLRQFPIDYLKIDHSFVRGINRTIEDEVITETVIRLAKFLNMKVVAEGVEERDQLRKLNTWGCDYFQGFLLNRPCTSDEIEAIV